MAVARPLPDHLPMRALAACVGAAAIWGGGRLSLPMVPAPITLQTLALVTAGGLLGPAAGALTGAVFLAAVLAGAPVLSGGASAPGLAFLELGTAGFVLGFVPGGAVAGLASGSWRRDAALFLAAHGVVLVAGFTWLLTRTDLAPADAAGSLLALLPGAALKSAVAASLVGALLRLGGPR